MSSKLSLSFAVALALSIATAGVARANPIPTSTDESPRARRAYQHRYACRCDFQPTGPITSSDDARAQAGRSLPAEPGAWAERIIANDEGEGRAAAYEGHQAPIENQSLAVSPAASGMTGGSNYGDGAPGTASPGASVFASDGCRSQRTGRPTPAAASPRAHGGHRHGGRRKLPRASACFHREHDREHRAAGVRLGWRERASVLRSGAALAAFALGASVAGRIAARADAYRHKWTGISLGIEAGLLWASMAVVSAAGADLTHHFASLYERSP